MAHSWFIKIQKLNIINFHLKTLFLLLSLNDHPHASIGVKSKNNVNKNKKQEARRKNKLNRKKWKGNLLTVEMGA